MGEWSKSLHSTRWGVGSKLVSFSNGIHMDIEIQKYLAEENMLECATMP